MSTFTRLASLAAVSVAAASAIAGATSASASTFNTVGLAPGQTACVQQYAAYQARADGTATAAGAKFKVLRSGTVINSTPSRANQYAAEFRSVWGNFPGPGYYSLCATNTGTTNTIVTLQVRTDGEI
ncbi:hypothetical protein FHX52_0559 [Humibacillus xanthopallidus]|uniref:Secreted protein n=1 Tax=Humibacillus xanthopallidus TaxID=412689 RepID=A0A543PTP5_9MICO|nr:hypothetical protein [Humibacillus xanthopallidus]TQN47457.1 hypothetical protein FHX52_0559 [Humibacillus xanthopallidus]